MQRVCITLSVETSVFSLFDLHHENNLFKNFILCVLRSCNVCKIVRTLSPLILFSKFLLLQVLLRIVVYKLNALDIYIHETNIVVPQRVLSCHPEKSVDTVVFHF
jgi:hypothetical protein